VRMIRRGTLPGVHQRGRQRQVLACDRAGNVRRGDVVRRDARRHQLVELAGRFFSHFAELNPPKRNLTLHGLTRRPVLPRQLQGRVAALHVLQLTKALRTHQLRCRIPWIEPVGSSKPLLRFTQRPHVNVLGSAVATPASKQPATNYEQCQHRADPDSSNHTSPTKYATSWHLHSRCFSGPSRAHHPTAFAYCPTARPQGYDIDARS
jgi:hypothetical protein